jgi:hypothetical protein
MSIKEIESCLVLPLAGARHEKDTREIEADRVSNFKSSIVTSTTFQTK